MNKFQFIAVAIFLWCGTIAPPTLIAQQIDSMYVPVADSAAKKVPIPSGQKSESYDTSTAGQKVKRQPLSRPKKALLWALVLPSAGQAYNKKFWKMPILYAGVGACAYFLITNQRGYSELKSAYNRNYDALEDNPTHKIYEDNLKYGTVQVYTSLAQLSSDRDTYRRYRDLSIAGSVALYAISILDAYVDAHLKEFDLSPDLSFSVKPLFYNYNNATFAPGLSLNLRLQNNRIQYNQLYRNGFSTED